MKSDNKTIFRITENLEVILYNVGTDTESKLQNDQRYLIFEHYPQEDFLYIYISDNTVPLELQRYDCGLKIKILLSESEVFEGFSKPEIVMRSLPNEYELENKICVLNLRGSLKEVLTEMYDVNFPTFYFDKYLYLKVMEFLLQLGLIYAHDSIVHYYRGK